MLITKMIVIFCIFAILFACIQLLRFTAEVRERRRQALRFIGDKDFVPPPPEYMSWGNAFGLAWPWMLTLMLTALVAAYIDDWLSSGLLICMAVIRLLMAKVRFPT